MSGRPTRSAVLITIPTTAALLLGGALARPVGAELLAHASATFDRRIVDVVEPGNAENEQRHGFAADSTVAGVTGGKSWRKTFGWMHYTLKTFEDTPVTLSVTLIADGTAGTAYDIVVEDSVVAKASFRPSQGSGSVFITDVAIPFDVTKGKAHIAVIVRAQDGATPAIHSIRTIQDHFEVQLTEQQFEQSKVHPSGVAR
ncbi:MAG: DUF6805 domain-containing protein [Gemmatimonas sp.]